MKILVTGSSGFVGSHVVQHLRNNYDVEGLALSASEWNTYQVDLRNAQSLHKILDQSQPNVIVHCAALTHVDYIEDHVEEAREYLVHATQNLVDWAKEKDVYFIYLSSDYVYEGKKEEQPYTEKSPTHPLNALGSLKLEAESAVSMLKHWAIFRPGVIFGYHPNGKNFLMQLLNLSEKRNVPSDQFSNPTDIEVLKEYISRAIEKNIQGIYNATGPEIMDRYTFALVITKVFELDSSLLVPRTTTELNQSTKRPLHDGLDISKLLNTLNYQPPSVEESLQAHKIKRDADFSSRP